MLTGLNNRKLIYPNAAIKLLSAILICTLWATALAQKATVDTTIFSIGKQVHLTLVLETTETDHVQWPQFGDTITRNIEIISRDKTDTTIVESTNKLRLHQSYTITSFDTGYIILPPIVFKVTDQSGQVSDLATEPVLLNVQKVPVDLKKDIRDIKPLLEAPYTLADFLPWILLLLTISLAGVLVWFYIRNRKKKKPLLRISLKPQVPPHVEALQQLAQLKLEKVWESGHIKEYYTRLTDVLRSYFEKRYGVQAAEMTSDEIMEAMLPLLVEPELTSALKQILTLADLAKFAKGQPIGHENALSMEKAETIIRNTAAVNKPAVVEKNSSENDIESSTQKLQ